MLMPVLLSGALALAATGSLAKSDGLLTLDTERQDVGSALMELGRASGVQILLAVGGGADVVVGGLHGEYRFEEALTALLAETGLTYEFSSENTVLVRGAQESPGEGEREGEGEKANAEGVLELAERRVSVERVVATGSRLLRGDPTAWVASMSAAEIAVLGVSDLEELFRTVPWSFPSTTSQTTGDRITGDPFAAPDTEPALGSLGFGFSSVNLRSLGSANTLVLVNGRRIAGTGGYEEGFANLDHIPLSAIKRVDIQLDGASAVYGADVIGGIVNIILKRDFHEIGVTARKEFSSSDADRWNVAATVGHGWNWGGIFVTATRTIHHAINNAKVGLTSYDFRDRYGPEFDLRSSGDYNQPGIVCDFNGSYRYPACVRTWLGAPHYTSHTDYYRLPEGHTGSGATAEDYIVSGPADLPLIDNPLPQNGADARHTALTMSLEQWLTDDLILRADVLHSTGQSSRHEPVIMAGHLVPASNAFNPFGRDVIVSYWPLRELEDGLLTPSEVDSDSRQRNYTVGFSWTIRNHELQLDTTRSASDHYVGLSSYGRKRYGDPLAARYHELLESSDRSVALNLFGDGSNQSPHIGELLGVSLTRHGRSEVTAYEAVIRGSLFGAPGGEVVYALGASRRETIVYHSNEWYDDTPGGLAARTGSLATTGVSRPKTRTDARFLELSIPIIGQENGRRGLRGLLLSVQARQDTYASTGGAGQARETSFDGVAYPYVPGRGFVETPAPVRVKVGELELVSTESRSTSLRVGLEYKPAMGLGLRASWSQAFKPPRYSQQFTTNLPWERYTFVTDLGHPSGEPVWPTWVRIYTSNANPDLRPETSDSYSAGLVYSPSLLPGLRWTADWSRIDFVDKIEDSYRLLRYHPQETFRSPAIAVRDADGILQTLRYTYVNVASKVSETTSTGLQYAFDSRWGNIALRLDYHGVLQERLQIIADGAPIERKNTSAGSPKYRLSGGLSWTRERLGADLFARYTPGYVNSLQGFRCREAVGRCETPGSRLPELRVDSLTTLDLTLTYQLDFGLRLRGGGRNIFLAKAPTIWNGLPYDPTRWDARGRVFFVELEWKNNR